MAVVRPAGIARAEGTVAAELLLDRETTDPPGAAGPLRVTFPTDELPPKTDVGFKLTDETAAGVIVRVADTVTPFSVAPMAALVCMLTPLVLTVNVAENLPAATKIDDGTVAAGLPEMSETLVPPAPAGPLRVAVPAEDVPPNTLVGFNVRDVRVAGVIVSVAFSVWLARVAWITAPV